ncbi:MAG: hypothetical protein ACTHMG_09735, partial [Sphingomonas sp.]
MSCLPKSAAVRRYNKRVLWLSVIYGVFLITAVYSFKHQLVAGPVAWAAAVLPALAIIGVFAAI